MLTTTSEYALRALIYLAKAPGRAVLGRELSRATGIPSAYLPKILLSLRKAGIISAHRGTRGGYRLGRPATAIYLIDIVELFEPVRRNPMCLLDGNKPCSADDPCSAHQVIGVVRASWTGLLISTTLDSISSISATPFGRSLAPVRRLGASR
jgi:Rrf2 family protein